jgi:uncharacterized protein (TIGR02453 family)
MKFDGFSKATLSFLRGIEAHNEKAWFEAHREEYERDVLGPAMSFVSAMGAKLGALAGDVHAEPKVGGSIFRIHRDVRFSKDKTPYKTHLDLWFWTGPSKKAAHSGFFFRLRPKTVLVGVGVHELSKEDLVRYREAVADPKKGEALAKLVTKLEKAGYEVGERRYKKVPAGYASDHPRAELLTFGALHAGIEMPVSPAVHSGELVGVCATHYKKLLPLHEWLVAMKR